MGIYIVFFLVMCAVFVNGATDAVNSVATCVSSGAMKMKGAVLLSAFFNLLGVITMGVFCNGVALTVKNTLRIRDGENVNTILISILISVALWAIAAWYFGLPTSESHGMIAALAGAGVGAYGIGGVDIGQLMKALYGVVFSSVIACALGFLICLFVKHAFNMKTDRFFKKAQVLACACSSFMHGGQDGVKLAGVFMIAIGDSDRIPIWLLLCVAAVMSAGTATGGKRIIKTIGSDMVCLSYREGFCADVAGAWCLLLASVCGGIPASTTQAKTFAMLGASLSEKNAKINVGIVKNMLAAQILTFPVCFILGAVLTRLLILMLF